VGAVGDVVSSIVDGAKSVVSAIAAPVAAIPVLGPLVSSAASAAVDVLGGPIVTGAELVQRAATDPLGTAISAVPALVSGLTATPDLSLVDQFLAPPSLDLGGVPMNGSIDPSLLDTFPADPNLGGVTAPSDPTAGVDLSQSDPNFNVNSDVIGSNAGGFPDVSSILTAGAGALTSALGGAMPARAAPGQRLLPAPSIPIIGTLVAKGIFNNVGRITAFGRSILGFLRKFGPGAGIALGLSAAEVANLLLHSTRHKRRRMNPCNTKALGRATRRLISFERRASRISAALSCIVHRAPRRRSRGHCFKCKRNPCVCG
jgi:hypothetical protein